MGLVTFGGLGDMGRLGNQLFQIASTIGIANKNNWTYLFPKWKYQKFFSKELPLHTPHPSFELKKELSFNYDEYRLNGFGRNCDLFGYFQSEKYWHHCKDEALGYFQFADILKRRVEYTWSDILLERPAAVHVRRGDYINLQDYHTLLPLEYYNNAMRHFDENQKFIVFSDDIEWCKKHFLTDKFSFAIGDEIEDLCLMSMCKGHIIANSSFSWWGAYLAQGKKVIAPKNWFGPKGPRSTKDLIPENWFQI